MSLRDLENETAEVLLNRIKELAPETPAHQIDVLADAFAAVVSKAPGPKPAGPSRVR